MHQGQRTDRFGRIALGICSRKADRSAWIRRYAPDMLVRFFVWVAATSGERQRICSFVRSIWSVKVSGGGIQRLLHARIFLRQNVLGGTPHLLLHLRQRREIFRGRL